MSADEAERAQARTGVLLALFAYVFWGIVTVFWRGLQHVPLLEIIAHRVLWSFIFVGLWLAWQGRLGEVRTALVQKRVRWALFASGGLLLTNWLVFVWAAAWGSVLEISLGYFINPLMSVALGMLLLAERLNRAQQIAIALAAVAVTVQAVGLGTIPIVALWLAATFAAYGYCRKTIDVRAAPGLMIESMVQLPLAIVVLGWIGWQTGTSSMLADGYTASMLLLTGPVTALPLIMFAAAARRLRLATMGLLQYSVPSIQFLLAVYLFAEPLGIVKLGTFMLIWLALVIFTTDALARERRATAR